VLYSKAVEQQRSVALERKYTSTSAKEKGSEPSELETFITPRELRISTTEHRKRDRFADYSGIRNVDFCALNHRRASMTVHYPFDQFAINS
jgi:hypothetical protein